MGSLAALINPMMPLSMRKALEDKCREKIEFIEVKTKKHKGIPLFLHPDIVGTFYEGGIIHAPDLKNHVVKRLKELGLDVRRGSSYLAKDYPSDAAYNALAVKGRFLLHRLDATDKVLKAYAKAKGWSLINTKQGYVKCSVIPASGDSFITEDMSISRALRKQGYSVLVIKKGFVSLRGYPYGFIGGASAVFERKVFFFGAIERHPSFEAVRHYLQEKRVEAFSLSDKILEDFGGMYLFRAIKGLDPEEVK